jgi:hypothetical protein
VSHAVCTLSKTALVVIPVNLGNPELLRIPGVRLAPAIASLAGMTFEILPTPKSHVPRLYKLMSPDRILTDLSPPGRFCGSSNQPASAFYGKDLRQFIIPYDEVRNSQSPEDTLLDFMQTTYEAAAALAKWDRALLEDLRYL